MEDQYKLKDLVDELPDDLEDEDSMYAPKKTFINKLLWKVFRIQPSKDTAKAYAKAVIQRKILIHLSKIVAKQLLKMFIVRNLEKLAVNKLDKHFHNGQVTDWFDQQIEKVYQENPNYQPLSIEEFKKTSIWQRNAAEWRDKTKNQIIRRLSYRMLTILITILCAKIPLPGAFLYSIPARIILAYIGIRIAFGSISHMVVQHGKDSLILGISLTKAGFEITNPELFVRRKSDQKIVRIFLPDPPKKIYEITEQDIHEIEKENASLDQIKKELKVSHDSSK